jgi:hypothetical protein
VQHRKKIENVIAFTMNGSYRAGYLREAGFGRREERGAAAAEALRAAQQAEKAASKTREVQQRKQNLKM